LIRIAYSVMDSQLVGPGWLDRVAFDVVVVDAAERAPTDN